MKLVHVTTGSISGGWYGVQAHGPTSVFKEMWILNSGQLRQYSWYTKENGIKWCSNLLRYLYVHEECFSSQKGGNELLTEIWHLSKGR